MTIPTPHLPTDRVSLLKTRALLSQQVRLADDSISSLAHLQKKIQESMKNHLELKDKLTNRVRNINLLLVSASEESGQHPPPPIEETPTAAAAALKAESEPLVSVLKASASSSPSPGVAHQHANRPAKEAYHPMSSLTAAMDSTQSSISGTKPNHHHHHHPGPCSPVLDGGGGGGGFFGF
uniref:Uncharacterized protein n=1 Tax=Octactis speculum TaxID=3111310 RepID=A0A7S2GNT7_9STRA